jgi:hypothetical protein
MPMTEAQWLVCDDLDWMLDHLLDHDASPRKLRLFACACSAPLQHLVKLPACQEALRIALEFVDGRVGEEELRQAWRAGVAAQPLFPDANGAAVAAANPDLIQALAKATELAAVAAARVRSDAVMGRARAAVSAGAEAQHRAEAWGKFEDAFQSARQEVRREQIFYLRCLFGNPFRPITVDPSWLTWNDATVVKVAATIYEEKHFDELPLLADALEEAGCLDDEILSHCRHDWEHFRGCHVLDALLQKS